MGSDLKHVWIIYREPIGGGKRCPVGAAIARETALIRVAQLSVLFPLSVYSITRKRVSDV